MFAWSRTIGDYCFVARQFACASGNLVSGNQFGAADVTLIKRRLGSYVNYDGLSFSQQFLHLGNAHTSRTVGMNCLRRFDLTRRGRASSRKTR